jgi:hypothetical protein
MYGKHGCSRDVLIFSYSVEHYSETLSSTFLLHEQTLISFEYYSCFKDLANICCDTDKERSHVQSVRYNHNYPAVSQSDKLQIQDMP